RLYGPELHDWLQRHGVQVQLGQAGRQLHIEGDTVRQLELRQGVCHHADWYIAAVPFERLLDLLPADLIDREPYFGNLRRLELSPITSVHLWYDRKVMEPPHVVLVGCVGQWVFNRGEVAPGQFYVQVVVSAARQLRRLGHEEVQQQITTELEQLFPRVKTATLLRARVVTEHAATFSAVPGVDRWRPPQVSPIRNLLVAGD